VFKNKYKDQFCDSQCHVIACGRFLYSIRAMVLLKKNWKKMNVKELNIAAISKAVINIRSSKLPDPKEIGNAGSFFQESADYERDVSFPLRDKHPDIPGYEKCRWYG